MDDFLALGVGMVERLRTIPGFKLVDFASGLESVPEMSQVVPAALVIYDGYSPTGQVGSGDLTMFTQRWFVVVVVRSAVQTRTGAGLVTDAGPLIAEVLRHLLGYRIAPFTALTLTNSPPALLHAGFGFYPLGFTVQAEIEAI